MIDSIETALKFGDGVLTIHRLDKDEDVLFSEHLADPETGFSFPPLEPRIFSFNSPHEACDACHGLGYRLVLDRESALNPNLSIREGGILPWVSMGSNALGWMQSVLDAIGLKNGPSHANNHAGIPTRRHAPMIETVNP